MFGNLAYSLRSGHFGDFVANRLAQWREPDAKIFFIGFNKCATSALWRFLSRQGIKSVHWQTDGRNVALEIERRLHDPAELKRYLGRWTAFSDLTYSSDERIVEGNRHFRLYHELFPRAYFVLNDRDVDGWIASRLNHRGGEFARRSARLRGCAIEDLPNRWMRDHREFRRAVFDHFAGYDRFLDFRVDRDDVSKLAGFFAPQLRLDPRHWSHENVSPQ